MKASNTYDFTLTAGGSFVLPVSGSYFRILTSTGALEVRGDFGRVGVLPGQGLREQDFTKLSLVDKSGSANIGTIFVSDGAFVDDRITGEVSVIDGAKARTLVGSSFIGAGASGPVAAQNAMVQLWNPVGSGKNLILENLKFSGGAAAPIDMGSYAVALTNLGVVSKSKFINSPSTPVAQVRNQANAGSLITVNMTSSYMPASQVQEYEFREPIVIPPGFGFVVCNATVNMNVLVAFEWLEDLI